MAEIREVTIRVDKVVAAQVEYYKEPHGVAPHRCITFTIDHTRLSDLRQMIEAAEKDVRHG